MKWILYFACSFLFADLPCDLSDQMEKQENWVFSPASISSCLSMVKDGARGATADEIAALVGDSQCTLSELPLEVAQGVWIQEAFPILPSYQAILETTYGAKIERVSFSPQSIGEINSWVQEKTHGLIQNLLPSSTCSPNTRMILASALHFSGNWLYPFPAHATAVDTFASPKGDLQTPFMTRSAIVPYFSNDICQALTLPLFHATDTYRPVCIFFLPHDTERPFSVTPSLIQDALYGSREVRVLFRIPKFRIEKSLELKEMLQKVGMERSFSPSADFSGIDGKGALFLSDIFHSATFSLNETGIEAAAATSAKFICTSASPGPSLFCFLADHPFSFVLMDAATNTVLFMGSIQFPDEQKSDS